MEKKLLQQSEMPEWLQKLTQTMYRTFFDMIEHKQLIIIPPISNIPKEWQELRQTFTDALIEAGFDATAISENLHLQFMVENGVLFNCPQCPETHDGDNHCFDCDQCQDHCDCPNWLEMAAQNAQIENHIADPCTACGGELVYLGTLGQLWHYRCRNCGINLQKSKN